MKKIIILITIFCVLFISFAFAKTFSDTSILTDSYIEAIDELSEKQVISGYPDGTFKPANTITRAEVVKMIVVAYDLKLDPQKEMTFSDIEGKWYEEYVKIAASNSIIYGYVDGTVKPENSITYAELSAVLNRILGVHTSTVKEEGEAWHSNSWKASEEVGILDNIATNDLLPDNKARRDNVALMIYNSLNYNPEENDVTQVEVPETNSGEIAKEPEKDINSDKIYFGVVDDKQLVRGYNTIDINMFNDETMTFTVRDLNNPPKDDELMFLKIRKSGSINWIVEIETKDLNDAYMVEKVDSEEGYAKLKGQAHTLDLEDDDYTFGEDKIVFNKMKFFEIQVNHKNDEYSFASGSEIDLEDVSLEENDRIMVNKTRKLFIIFKGLENDDVID